MSWENGILAPKSMDDSRESCTIQGGKRVKSDESSSAMGLQRPRLMDTSLEKPTEATQKRSTSAPRAGSCAIRDSWSHHGPWVTKIYRRTTISELYISGC